MHASQCMTDTPGRGIECMERDRCRTQEASRLKPSQAERAEGGARCGECVAEISLSMTGWLLLVWPGTRPSEAGPGRGTVHSIDTASVALLSTTRRHPVITPQCPWHTL